VKDKGFMFVFLQIYTKPFHKAYPIETDVEEKIFSFIIKKIKKPFPKGTASRDWLFISE